jgi:gamma-glutamyltranspeptidase
MTPTIVHNSAHPCGKRLILGASNGTRIITGVIETLVNALVFDLDINNAVALPRIHNQLYPDDVTEYEGEFVGKVVNFRKED